MIGHPLVWLALAAWVYVNLCCWCPFVALASCFLLCALSLAVAWHLAEGVFRQADRETFDLSQMDRRWSPEDEVACLSASSTEPITKG